MTNHNLFGSNSWQQIVKNSVKIINFYDMGGSEGALKTTVKLY
jgi:GTPase